MRTSPSALQRTDSIQLPTRWGQFLAIGLERDVMDGSGRVESAIALILGDMAGSPPLLRIHSQCATGDALGSLRCDCGEQLEFSMSAIAREGRGLLIYEQQEVWGIGLMAKLKAYLLQDAGFDTVDANPAPGFLADCRDYFLPTAFLQELGVDRVRLLSNNPQKALALKRGGIEVIEELSCDAPPKPPSITYLQAKRERMGNTLTLDRCGSNLTAKLIPAEGVGARGKGFRVGRREQHSVFASIDSSLHELREGRMVVVVDDEGRENEGDLVMAAEMIVPDAINFMSLYGGLICVAMTGDRLDELEIGPIAVESAGLHGSGFTVSIDAIGRGVTTGISAHDRVQTILAAIDPHSKPRDFVRPGSVLPLRSRAGGVLEHRGHTEAAVDLARLAGLQPGGVTCEILNDDGNMARVPDLVRFCQRHDLKMITVGALAVYRLEACLGGGLNCQPQERQRLSTSPTIGQKSRYKNN